MSKHRCRFSVTIERTRSRVLYFKLCVHSRHSTVAELFFFPPTNDSSGSLCAVMRATDLVSSIASDMWFTLIFIFFLLTTSI
jgi:hypothetical protein